MWQKLLNSYVVQLRRIWRRIPARCLNFRVVQSFGRHVHRVVRLTSSRSQHFATFFMRNRAELDLLRRVVDRMPEEARCDITVLACGNGAEVYSIAWIIRSARPDIDLRIHAIDISPELVEFAARGVYSMRRPTERDISIEDALRQKTHYTSLPSSDKHAWTFERLSAEEIGSIFEVCGDQAIVPKRLREGITWHSGDACDLQLPAEPGTQDVVFADRFLFHMLPPAAESCLRNIERFVKPGGYLFVGGIDLDIRTKVACERGWIPVAELILEIHDADDVRGAWPMQYWGLEPFDDRRPDWQLRYAAVFQIGHDAPSGSEQSKREARQSRKVDVVSTF